MAQIASSHFQTVIETVEALSPEEQSLLVEVVRQRLISQRRTEMIADVVEARAAYQQGVVQRGSVAELMEAVAE